MDTNIVYNLLAQRLGTADLMREAAKKIGVSLATMYRYKSNPALIPLGKLVTLCKNLAYPLSGNITWSKTEVVQGERRRYELEAEVAKIEKGRRFVITPCFTVASELPEVTRQLWDYDYGTRYSDQWPKYLDLRKKRSDMYAQGKYESYELINANCYRDFFHVRERFGNISKELRARQIDRLIESLDYPHVLRRVYLRATPELPVFSCYSTDKAIIRIDDIIVEFNDQVIVRELRETFDGFFDSAELKTKNQVKEFLKKPD